AGSRRLISARLRAFGAREHTACRRGPRPKPAIRLLTNARPTSSDPPLCHRAINAESGSVRAGGPPSSRTLIIPPGSPIPEEIPMQPPTETVGDLRTNGAPPAGVPGESIEGRPNGGASAELQDLLNALQAMRVGDFSVRMPGNQVGLLGKVADNFNEIVAANERMAQQLERVGHVVGREG